MPKHRDRKTAEAGLGLVRDRLHKHITPSLTPK